MLIALLIAYLMAAGFTTDIDGTFLPSSKIKQLKKQVVSAVDDRELQNEVKQRLGALQVEAENFEKEFTESGKSLNKAYRDHQADAADMVPIFAELNQNWQAFQQHTLGQHFALKASLSEAQWNAVFATATDK